MCGILGVIGKKSELYGEKKINSMLGTLSKRGPDDSGVLRFPECILGHTRLSIIDLSSGHQPMKDNQKNIAITFNGEIYNYKELKANLKNKNHIFSTNSDTEVILKAYIEYGEKCVDRLDGMFAFAIWDEEKKIIFMARDRFGKKPLYYAYDDFGNFIFASEIKTLFASGALKGKIDYEAIDNYFHLLYIPPMKTAYENIFTLNPAHFALYKNGSLKKERYWSIPCNPLEINELEAEEKLKHLLSEAVKKRMIADVEVGTFLSGGVDSSIITYLAKKQTDKPLKSFSAGFEDYINELPFAKKVSQITGTDHHELQMKAGLAEILEKVCVYFDEPFADSSSIPQFLISQFANQKVKVVLSGDGGDEMFLGYGWYWKQFNLGFKERLKRFLRRGLKQMFFPNIFQDHIAYIAHFNRLERWFFWKEKKFANAFFPTIFNEVSELSTIKKINLFDINMYLPGDILTKVDRASMMASLEVRSPFLDYQLAEFVFNLPEEYKTNKRIGKLILKNIFKDVFGEEFLNRRKQGFSAPVKNWLWRNDFKTLVQDLFSGKNAHSYKFLNEKYIKKIIEKFYLKNDLSCHYKIWILLCLELWFKAHSKYHL